MHYQLGENDEHNLSSASSKPSVGLSDPDQQHHGSTSQKYGDNDSHHLLAQWSISSSYQSYLRRESSSSSSSFTAHSSVATTTIPTKSSCSSSAKTTSASILSSVHDGYHLPSSTENEKKPSCHSQSSSPAAATTAAAAHGCSQRKTPSSSNLPISSLQFWSDPKTWNTASVNTFRCLVGCTIGDMSMLFYLQSVHPTLSPGIAMGLAMTSGVLTSISLETILLRFSKASNMSWRAAFKTATGMSLISMLTMEAVENAVDYHLMGWGNVNIMDPLFWKAIGWSALAGWSAPLPFNYWNLRRHGKSCH
ncbi:hypothetical protein BGZ65_005922 [Modicella reniformis]|uniref:DUF4396 domain-containing protein n=1 Tax=Modicella reniformis TaxID=1440133 RepID=A0A9P6JLF7_9FUNG|nr:hypothetical protein BGZ65_005922 [Modicella reniformis]